MAQETIQEDYVRVSGVCTPPDAPAVPATPVAVTPIRITNMAPIVWGVVLGNLITGAIGALLYALAH